MKHINTRTSAFTIGLLTIVTLAILAAGGAPASAGLLTPEILHPLAHWGGSQRDGTGFLQPSQVAPLHDGNVSTVWNRQTGGLGNMVSMTPMLTSPHPFVVTQAVAVANGAKSAGTIQIMKVGTADFIDTGLSVPDTLTAGEVWTMDMPLEHQVPISAIRLRFPIWDPEMRELSFYGSPIEIQGGKIVDITSQGTVRTYPGTEGGSGITHDGDPGLTNGVFEDDNTGYYVRTGGAKSLIIDFGAGVRQDVLYTAWNPNYTWNLGSWTAAGTTGDYSLGAISDLSAAATSPNWTGSGAGGAGAPGHAWVVTAVNGGNPLALGSAGGNLATGWNTGASEIVVLGFEAIIIPEPSSLMLLGLAGLGLLRRRNCRKWRK